MILLTKMGQLRRFGGSIVAYCPERYSGVMANDDLTYFIRGIAEGLWHIGGVACETARD